MKGLKRQSRRAALAVESLEVRRVLTSISGTVFEDLNINGTQDAGEAGLAGLTLFLDQDDDGLFDPTLETSTQTDNAGNFLFTGLDPQAYVVGLVPTPEFLQLVPTGTVSLDATVDVVDVDFALRSNLPPNTVSDSAVTNEDVSVNVRVLDNDSDTTGELDPSSVAIVDAPTRGTTQIEADGSITYTPLSNFFGSDQFRYTVQDEHGLVSAPTLVNLTINSVNDLPVSNDDTITIIAGTSTPIGVLKNDSDADSLLDGESILITQQPVNGVAQVDPSVGLIRYQPSNGFVGQDTLRYSVADEEGGRSNESVVTLNVVASGTPPTTNPDALTLFEGSPDSIDVIANDIPNVGAIVGRSVLLTRAPEHAIVIVTPGTGRLIVRPNLGFTGSDSFGYVVQNDAGFTSFEGEVSLEIQERDFPYQNPLNRFDVDNDGFVVPRDALLLINELNNRQVSAANGSITVFPESPNQPVAYFDVRADNFIVSNDALQLINFLNAQAAAAGEPPATFDAQSVAAAFASDDLLD